jgi:NAD(P)-dependent dehydrogenase (short-subunit alcohol dehydrogenase family)
MNMKLANKVAAITGAGSGIGKSAAELFAREGATVIILDLNEQNGAQVEQSIRNQGGKAHFLKVDISNHDAVKQVFQEIKQRFGELHVLYNNASVFLGGRDNKVTELDPAIWQKVLNINLSGLFYCSKYAIPIIIASGGGSVINTASSAGVIGIPNCDAYTASKGATVTLTRSMAVEYGPSQVRVNCIAPAAIYTPMVKESNLDDDSFDEEEFLRKGTPLRRWGKPEEIAQIALFLASEQSSYMNGAILVADGGITIS